MFKNKYELLTRKQLVVMSKTKTVIAVLVAMVISIVYPFVVNMIDEKSVASNTVHLTLTYHIFVQLCFYVLWFANSWAITQTAQQFNTVFIQVHKTSRKIRLFVPSTFINKTLP